MVDTKKANAIKNKIFYKSKMVIGFVVAFLPGLSEILGFSLPGNLPDIATSLLGFVDSINEVVGAVLMAAGTYYGTGRRIVLINPDK